MARTNNSKWMCLLAFVLMIIPAIVADGDHRAVAAPATVDRATRVTDASTGSVPAELIASPPGICPFSCTSSAQCTTGCQTEALCINHRCTPL